jgi:hypothetical protein
MWAYRARLRGVGHCQRAPAGRGYAHVWLVGKVHTPAAYFDTRRQIGHYSELVPHFYPETSRPLPG